MTDDLQTKPVGWPRVALPLLVLALALVAVVRGAATPHAETETGLGLGALSRTAVLADGRVKPLDTVARTELLILSGRQRLEHRDSEIEAIQWLADVLARPDVADGYAVFRVDHEDVLAQVGLMRSDGIEDKRFSYTQLSDSGRRATIARQAAEAQAVEGDDRDAYQSAVLKLESHLQRYEALQVGSSLGLAPPGEDAEDPTWLTADRAAQQAAMRSADGELVLGAWATVVQVRTSGVSADDHARRVMTDWAEGRVPDRVAIPALFYQFHAAGDPAWSQRLNEFAQATGSPGLVEWGEAMRPYFAQFEASPTAYGLMDASDGEQLAPGAREFAAALTAYREADRVAMDAALAERAEVLDGLGAGSGAKRSVESWFNRFMPFLQAQVLNIAAFVLGFVVLFFGKTRPRTWGRSLWWSVMALLAVALLVHTLGLGTRVWLQGRPPVTTLYSSAVFIGWVAVVVCLLVEWFSRLGIAAVTGALIGFTTLIIAHHLHLAFEEDTMQPMRAVLDSNFWLATHVVIITVGYAATFVAGILAVLYIALGMATPVLDRPTARLITQMVYGTICFALLFSFVGTVLGGIWADQSWGRFWGWDPKENGAVLIVMMNALILHAKWGRMIRERGLMCLAVVGNIITGWSWFGTNLLGVGLHSYGFMEGAMMWLLVFAVGNLLIIAVALAVPTKYWWSFRPKRPNREQRSSKPVPSP